MTNSTPNKRIVEKLKKLFALGNSANPHEAANAMKKAQLLMKAHNLNAADVSLAAITSSESGKAPSSAQKIPRYVSHLGQTITRATGCRFIWRMRSGKRTLVFYGAGERPQIASYLFDVLSRQISAARRGYISLLSVQLSRSTKTARADAYCEAWASGVYHSISEFIVPDEEKTLVAAWFANYEAQRGAPLTTAETRAGKKASGTERAALAGYRAGQQVKVHQPVNGQPGSTPELLGVTR